MTETSSAPTRTAPELRPALVRAAYDLLSSDARLDGLVERAGATLALRDEEARRIAGDESAFHVSILELRDERAEGIVPFRGGIATLRGMLALALHNQRRPGLMTLYTRLSGAAAAPDHPAHDSFRKRYAWVRGMLTLAFEEMRAAGELRVDTPSTELARSLMALMDGLQVQWLLEEQHLDMEAQLHGWLDAVVAVEL